MKGVTMTLSYQRAFRKDKENLAKLGISGVLFIRNTTKETELTGVQCLDLSGLWYFDTVSLKSRGNLLYQVGSFLLDIDFDARLARA